MQTNVQLHLVGHCIQTAAKKEYQRLQNLILESSPPLRQEETQLELLRRFIAQTDFRELRNARPELAGQTPLAVSLTLDSTGAFEIQLVTKDRQTEPRQP